MTLNTLRRTGLLPPVLFASERLQQGKQVVKKLLQQPVGRTLIGWRQLPRAKAQAMVEFALLLPLLIIVLFVTIQLALIGMSALALAQADYQAARYAAVNNVNATQALVSSYVLSVASPAITDDGGANLSVSLNPCASPPNTAGSPVSVTLTYTLQTKLFLPNPFLGISFPASLSSTETAYCE